MKKYNLNYDSSSFDLAVNIADSALDEYSLGNYNTIEEAVLGEVDSRLIFDSEKWEILQYYQRPEEANFSEALEKLISEIYEIIKEEEGLSEDDE